MEWKGEWWIPNGNEKLYGKVVFSSPTEFFLKLKGTRIHFQNFLTIENSKFNQRHVKIILGETEKQTKITLCNNKIRHERKNERIFLPDFAIIGKHYSNVEEIKFKKFSIKFDFIERWLELDKVSCVEWNTNGEIRIKKHEPMIVGQTTINDEEGKQYIVNSYFKSCTKTRKGPPAHQIIEEPFLYFEFSEPIEINKALQLISIFKLFFSILVGKKINILKISIFAKTIKN